MEEGNLRRSLAVGRHSHGHVLEVDVCTLLSFANSHISLYIGTTGDMVGRAMVMVGR